MKTVYKYQLFTNDGIMDEIVIQIPEDFIIRHLNVQNGVACIWAEVDTETKMIEKHFLVFGTGHDLGTDKFGADKLNYIGSVMMGSFVWHIYEKA
jgi:hypothetical protein